MAETKYPPDNEQRRRVVDELDKTMLVEAAAGTGKTTSMLDRMVSLLKRGHCQIDTMAAVTFTRKAAAELRIRFQVALERAAREADGFEKQQLNEALSRVERCFIGTIHSFCARLLRERPIEAGVDLSFQEIEPLEDLQLRESAWSEYVADLYARGDSLLADVTELGLEFGQLYPSFLTYANHPDVDEWPAPDVELGDLDSARQQLADYIDHMKQLAPTFPRDRGRDKLMEAYEDVIRLARNRELEETAQLFEVLQQFKKRTCVQKCWPSGQPQGKAERDRWVEFTDQVAHPLVERWFAKRYATIMCLLAGAAQVYDQTRASLGQLNYQDLLMKAASLLRDKPEIRNYFRGRFTHLLVDEFQDTDPVQAEIMMFLTASDNAEQDWHQCCPVAGSLFVVGDPKQSIYRFRRADIVTYNQVKEIIVNSGGEVVPLTSNFRTLGDLVNWNNDVFANHFPTEASTYSPANSPMDVGREDDSDGALTGIRTLVVPEQKFNKNDATEYEADFIARYIRHALDHGLTLPRTSRQLEEGVKPEAQPGDFLIITWAKKQLFEYARALQQLQIPHEVSGSSALSQVGELTLLLNCLRALIEPENSVALVAVLRGPLFGISDAEFYAFKRAGGRFSYRAPVPNEIPDSVSNHFHDAYQRLQRYDLWLRRLPPVSALERIAFDLGLPMKALSSSGGRVLAGSLAKAFQLLRAAQSEYYSIDELATYLETLLDEKTEFDGVPVRPYERSVVRVMNLHKAKGLEAPVVFLADPTGRWAPPVTLHIDRVGDNVKGYMVVYESLFGWSPPVLAKPHGWDAYGAEEKRFEDAEDTRMLYVAATRAGAQLTVVQHEDTKANNRNYWKFFQPYLADAAPLNDPGQQHLAVEQHTRIGADDVRRSIDGIKTRWDSACEPTYGTVAAKEIAISAAGLHRPPTAGEHGTEWGTVIHFLLEAAMRQPKADLHDLAYAALEEQGLEPARVDDAIQTVNSVMRSDLWRRAHASEKMLVEVPFQRCIPADLSDGGVPTILRGVIDLVFREDGAWIVVDYKTDAAAATSKDRLIDHYRSQVELYAKEWEEMTSQAVREKAIFFTASKDYVVL